MPEQPFRFAPGCSQTPKHNTVSPILKGPLNISYDDQALYYGEEDQPKEITNDSQEENISKQPIQRVVQLSLFSELLKLKVEYEINHSIEDNIKRNNSRVQKVIQNKSVSNITDETKQKIVAQAKIEEIFSSNGKYNLQEFIKTHYTYQEEIESIISFIDNFTSNPDSIILLRDFKIELREISQQISELDLNIHRNSITYMQLMDRIDDDPLMQKLPIYYSKNLDLLIEVISILLEETIKAQKTKNRTKTKPANKENL